jgi:hypothetical protein
MSDDQENLANNFQSFINYAVTLDVDFQIGVVTTDVEGMISLVECCGKLVSMGGAPKIITPDTPDVIAEFQKNIRVGDNGSGNEQGLEGAYLALSYPLITTEIAQGGNMEFLREPAYLTIICVSDEPDQSPEAVDFYVDFFKNLKGYRAEDKVALHVVVGQPDSCGWEATRYNAAADALGGIKESICTQDWAQTLNNLGFATFSLPDQFFLSRHPNPDTIEVTVDGNTVPRDDTGAGGWLYDEASNSVAFATDDVPEGGAVVEVTYEAECLQ